MLSTHSMKVIRISIDRDSRTEFKALTTFERHSSSTAVAMHRLISSCINSEVVIDFLMMVKMIFSVNWYMRLWKRRMS
jgi:hypothetical protein